MAQQKGSTVDLLLGFEAVAFGTVAVDGFQLPVNSFGLRANRAKNRPATLGGSRNPVAPFDGNLIVSGPIVVPVDSLAMLYWAKAMFGAAGISGGGPYVHEYKILDAMPSISLETAYTDLATAQYDRFTGCRIASMSIEFGGDGELVMTLNVVGANEGLQSSAFDGTPTAVAIARVSNFQAAILEGGSSLANARTVSLEIDFGLDQSNYVIGGSGILGSLPEGTVGVSGRLVTLFENTTLLAKAIASTESSLKITVTSAATSIFELEIQELQYERTSPVVDGPQGLLVDLAFQGYYTDGAEASAVVMRLTNSVTSAV